MKKISLFIKCIAFVLIFALLFQRASLILQVHGTDKTDPDRRACLFFSLPAHTVDVLFAGTSHVYCSYIPKKIYNKTGITSAILATSAQSYENTYYLLKEALLRQSPKVVILDLHSITSSVDEAVLHSRLHCTSGISSMPDLSINKIFAYRDISSNKEGWAENMTIYDAYAFLEYKNEYDRGGLDPVLLANLLFNPASEFATFGYYPTDTVYPMTSLKPSVVSSAYKDMRETDDFLYMEKIIKLLREKNIALLFVRAPYNRNLDDKHLYEQAFAYLKENNIPIVDFFDLIDEIGINLKTDFRDEDHLNYLGSVKATRYMCKYLQEHYSLEDHRGGYRYRLWEQNAYDYKSVKKRIEEKIPK